MRLGVLLCCTTRIKVRCRPRRSARQTGPDGGRHHIEHPQDQQDPAAGAKLTEDNHVPAVVSVVVSTPAFYDCLQRRRVFYVPTPGPPRTRRTRVSSRHPLLESPSQYRIAVTTTTDDLQRQGYFHDPGAQYGVVYSDHPWWRAAASTFEQEAARYGVRVSLRSRSVGRHARPRSRRTSQRTGSSGSAAAGVDHVVMLIDATSRWATWLASPTAAA